MCISVTSTFDFCYKVNSHFALRDMKTDMLLVLFLQSVVNLSFMLLIGIKQVFILRKVARGFCGKGLSAEAYKINLG